MHSKCGAAGCADSRLTARNFPYCWQHRFNARNSIKGICRMTVNSVTCVPSVDAAGNGGSIAITSAAVQDAVAGSVRSW